MADHYELESYPDYLARKAREAAAEPAAKQVKAKAVEDKAVKAEDDEAK
jgi:hypothetical protein